MKKAGKLISYLLVLALVTGLFSGIGYAKSPSVVANAGAGDTFNVLEIVPDKSMATFFYFVDLTKNGVADPLIGSKTIETNCAAGTFNDYLEDAGCGELVGTNFVSEDFFVENVLKKSGAYSGEKVKITTATPDTLTDKMIGEADFIVINETVPTELQVSGISIKSFSTNQFKKGQALKIFKKIAGVFTYEDTVTTEDGKEKKVVKYADACPYIIDYNLYNKASFSDVRLTNEKSAGGQAKNNKSHGYIPADRINRLNEGDTPGDEDVEKFSQNSNSTDHIGSSDDSYKLYKLLTCTDPATLYGLYFTGSDGSYGVDEDLNLITITANAQKPYPVTYNLDARYPAWSDRYFRPNYLATANNMIPDGSDMDNNAIIKAMGWFEAGRNAGAFIHVVGGKEGKGIAYNSADGLFYVMKSSGETITTAPDPTTTPDPTPAPIDFTVKVSDTTYTVKDKVDEDDEEPATTLTKIVRDNFGQTYHNALSKDDFIAKCASYSITVKYSATVSYSLTYSGKTVVVTNLEELKDVLKELGVPQSTIDTITEYPIKTGYPNEIKDGWLGNNSIFGNDAWRYTNQVSNPSFVLNESWTLGDGTAITSNLLDKNNQIAFLKSRVSIGTEDVPNDAASLKSLLQDYYIQGDSITVTDNNASATPTTTPTPTVSVYGADKFALMVGAFNSGNNVDYHPYRFLIITDSVPDTKMNRTVIAKMVDYANSKGKGLAGGILVDCMSKKQFENICLNLNQTYDAICNGADLSTTSTGNAKLSTYSGPVLSGTDGFKDTKLISKFKELLDTGFGIHYNAVPTEYFVNYSASYMNMNSWGGNGYNSDGTSLKVDKNLNFINDDDHSGRNTLDFSFVISKSGKYTIDLYVDVSNDGIYGNTDKEHKTLSSSFEGKKEFSQKVPISDFMPENFVGGFGWKLVVKNNDTGKAISRIGYSAIRNEKEVTKQDKHKIRILQVYPTDYSAKFGNDDGRKFISNPMLLLPTNDEKTEAKDGKKNDSGDVIKAGHGDISNAEWDGEGNANLQDYFNGFMSVDVAKEKSEPYDLFDSSFGDDAIIPNSVIEDPSGKRQFLLINSAIFYKFLAMLEDYEIETDRYSVYSFSQAIHDGDIVLDEDTGRFAPAGSAGGGAQVKNLDGSDRYGYTSLTLKLPTNWENEGYNWSTGWVPKYMVDGSYIFGERSSAEGSVKYYGAKEQDKNGTLQDGTPIRGADEDNEYDMLMLGFGSSMDYMDPTAVSKINTYLKNGGPAFVGNGTVTTSDNNNLGKTIAGTIGMDLSKPISVYDPFTSENQTMMITNDTLFSHYPFKINHYMKTTDGSTQPYKLKLSDSTDDNFMEPVVSYTRYKSSNTNAYGVWGNSDTTYYLYRKGNVTFCGFGNTFRAQAGKVTSVMTIAETLMIVNALITSASGGQSPIADDPYIKCVDIDASYIGSDQLEGDMANTWRDSVYTNYDSNAIAAFKKDNTKNTFNTPLYDTKDATEVFGTTAEPKHYSEDDGDDMLHEGFVDPVTNIRWIPYEATLTTFDGGLLEFYKANNDTTVIPVTIKKFQFHEVGTSGYYSFDTMSKDSTSGKYKIDENGFYYIGIPLDKTTYSDGFLIDKTDSSKNSDQFSIKFKLFNTKTGAVIEQHVILMVRRIIYNNK